MAEEAIYADGRVTVTTENVMIRGKTFAVKSITAVKMSVSPQSKGCITIVIIFSLLFFLSSLANLSVIQFVASLAILISAVTFWFRSNTKYHVVIETEAGRTRALTSEIKSYVERIVAGIQTAIDRYRAES